MLSKNLGNKQDKDNEKNSDSDNIKINNIQSKSITQINYMNNNIESDYLEKRFIQMKDVLNILLKEVIF